MCMRHGCRINIDCVTSFIPCQSNLERLTSEVHEKTVLLRLEFSFKPGIATGKENRRLTPSVFSDIVMVICLLIESLQQTAEQSSSVPRYRQR